MTGRCLLMGLPALALLLEGSDSREVQLVVRDSLGRTIPQYAITIRALDRTRLGPVHADQRIRKIALSPGRYQIQVSASLHEPSESILAVNRDTEIIQLYLNPVFWGETATRAPEIVITIPPRLREEATLLRLQGVFNNFEVASLVKQERITIAKVPYGSYIGVLLGENGVIGTLLFDHEADNNEFAFRADVIPAKERR